MTLIVISDKALRIGMLVRLGFLSGILLLGGCASTLAPHNDPLEHFIPNYGYRFANLKRDDTDGGLLLSVSFSGGGTRAATLAYGVMEEMARTPIKVQGKTLRLLDVIDSISAVSGGSYPAAYYGLFGDRLFTDFESRFLKRDVQSEIVSSLFSPVNLFRMTSPFFGRSDVMAEYMDELLFEGKTFGDLDTALRQHKRPFIQINATDMSRVSRFEFSQEQFDLICSDLYRYGVSRAVTASSAVPVAFSPITLKNYAGQCGYTRPIWMDEAAQNRKASLRRYHIARDLLSYLDAEKRQYVHLVDGGVSDNLGLRGALDRLSVASAGDIAASYEIQNIQRVVQIVVNAQARTEFTEFDQRAEVPSLSAIAFTVANATDRYSVETLALMRASMESTVASLKAQRGARGMPNADDVKAYLIEVTFDELPDSPERTYFNELPTTFRLPPEAVDRLREVAGRILRNSPAFRQLLEDLR